MAEHGGPVPPYGVAIHNAIAKGDVVQMKQLVKEAEEYLHKAGELSASLEMLKIAIAKAEKKH
jgi:uncharacterized protein DUF1843